MIPYGRQIVSRADVEAVSQTLRADRITQGPGVEAFEAALAEAVGVRYVVAVSSGTAGLHLACLAAGIGSGDALITSPNTFVASANCALYCGASVHLADIDLQTYNMDPHDLERCLDGWQVAEIPRAVVPVHFAGSPCDPSAIYAIAERHGLTVIEDGCHAIGARWQDPEGRWQSVGNCSHSGMTVFSFHPVKHITTGEGGAVTTNDESLYRRLVELRSHGVTRDPARMRSSDGPWYYEVQHLGFNYRITDFQCALGLSQLSNLVAWVERRRSIAAAYHRDLADLDELVLPGEADGRRSSWHLYVIRTREGKKRRRHLYDALREAGVGVQVHYIPVHHHPLHAHLAKLRPLANSEVYYESCLSLPIFPGLTDAEYEKCVEAVRRAVGAPM